MEHKQTHTNTHRTKHSDPASYARGFHVHTKSISSWFRDFLDFSNHPRQIKSDDKRILQHRFQFNIN